MSHGAMPVFRRINKTPLRDLLRGRITAGLDWEANLHSAGLPPAASELIGRVVKRTRLFRAEKVAVASELIAHFLDGLAAGSTAAELVERFGDERIAARLIRRAKRRGRSLVWHAWSVGFRITAVVAVVYAILFFRLWLGRPTVAVNYLTQLNEPILQLPQNDRAWPLWRQAIIASADGMKDNKLDFSQDITSTSLAPDQESPPWSQTVKWLDDHASAVELARAAGRKAAMGFILGPGGSADDPQIFFHTRPYKQQGEPLINMLLPHLMYLRYMANVLSLDAQRAAEKGNGAIVESDLMSMLGLAGQLRTSDGTVISQLVSLAIRQQMWMRLQFIFNEPSALKDDQLIRLAHSLSIPTVAADLVTFNGERVFIADVMQRLYTDDGHGDGHLVLHNSLAPLLIDQLGETTWRMFMLASTVPTLTASRAQVMTAYNRFMDQQEANLHLPIREIDVHEIDSQIQKWKQSPVDRIRYAILIQLMPSFLQAQTACERYLGERDGAMVGIALELYHRRHGKYPLTLSELVPGLLPQIPADRITGDPVKYRLIDGKPVVYSVGADRIDDGGVPSHRGSSDTRSPAAVWGKDPAEAPHGDWILFSPKSAAQADN